MINDSILNKSRSILRGVYRLPLIVKMYTLAEACRLRRLFSGSKAARDHLRHRELWFRGIPNELAWWQHYLSDDPVGRQWQLESQDEMQPVTDQFLVSYFQDIAEKTIRIIDVGAGPITKIGYALEGKKLEIVSIDPLARYYHRLLKRNGIGLPVNTIEGDGESLLKKFGLQSFDIAYACNSLDHSYDPIIVIQNMIQLIRPPGYVLLRHFRNEAEAGAYDGLHQWNFDCEGGRFIIWNARNRIDVSKRFEAVATTICTTEPAGQFDDWNECILVAMRVGDGP
jgi:SAM-dependent methyltransferase